MIDISSLCLSHISKGFRFCMPWMECVREVLPLSGSFSMGLNLLYEYYRFELNAIERAFSSK